ncbi:MAG: REP-associated tyrosine transposase [Thermodesulfobacteriota bacterium]
MPYDFRRKTNRLKNFDYASPYIYFITICTANRKEIFNNYETVSEVVKQLKETADKLNFQILAYCFMPDHVHLLVGLNEADADLIGFIRHFKQKTEYDFRKRHDINLWQRSFYDHILRKEESVIETVRYIFNNPVRKGLVKKFKEYPFLGYMVFDIRDI